MLPTPPKLSDLPAGYRLRAGLGYATVLPDMDFETYSEAGCFYDELRQKWHGPRGAQQGKKGLPVVGAAVYASHPSTELLSLAYNLKDGRGPQLWTPGCPPPQDLFDHIQAGGLIEAWNSQFENWIWEQVCHGRMGWPALPQVQLRDAMAKARSFALPGSLGNAAKVLGIETQKDADGKRLLDLFSIPRNPTKKDARLRLTPADLPADGMRLYQYNLTDIEAEAEASSLIPDLEGDELRYWHQDQAINHRGIRIDVVTLEACRDILDQAFARYDAELHALTGGQVERASQLERLKGWLAGHAVYATSMDEEGIEELLKRDLPAPARRAIEIRQLVGSASVKKVYAMLNQHRDGHLHDLYSWHGARTGRPTGQGPQPTNLPKAGPDAYQCHGCNGWHGSHTIICPWCSLPRSPLQLKAKEWNPEATEWAIQVLRTGSLAMVERYFGHALLTISGVMRAMFISDEGHDFVSSDFTAIEGVVIACLSGEQWRVDAYAKDEPMYLLSASRMYGVPVQEMLDYAKEHGKHHPLRQKGKGGELGLGFGGWIQALRNFGVDGPDEELKQTVLAWRKASPELVYFWGGQVEKNPQNRWDEVPKLYGLEGMAIKAIREPGQWHKVLRRNGGHTGISYMKQGEVLYCMLPSGRTLTYHRPRLTPILDGWRAGQVEISFEGWNSNAMKGPPGWMTMKLYGGLLAENVTQAVARDIQMNAIDNCEQAGYVVRMHTYDEIVAEVPEGQGSVEHLERLMTSVPSWAAGWPIKAAGGWREKRYRKG